MFLQLLVFTNTLSKDRLVQGGYVPNLVPILLWDRPATGLTVQDIEFVM